MIGYQFDDSGNTKVDAANRQFIYDGENKQVEVRDQSGASIGKYFFDGDGKRVKKISATETTIFVYNASGQLVAEYSTQTTQTPQVSYLTADHLGSPRINTDENGKVIARHDFQPFGEEIARPSYGADDVRQKFTGYERDKETELDFAQARFYESGLGRFTSPDEPFAGQYEQDPQTWNLYAYTSNNPVARIDPDGRRWFHRTVGNILEIQWVNPNEDGTFTTPAGKGWIMQQPGDVLSLYSAEDDTTYYLSESDDGTPRVNGIKTNRGVEDVSLELFTGFQVTKGAGLTLKGIYNGAKALWATYLLRQAEKKLVQELAELTTDKLMEKVGKEGVEMFRDVFGKEFGAINVKGAEATRIARQLLRMGVKKIPEGLTREQLLAYRQIALNAIKNNIDKGAQAERIKTIDYLLRKVKN